MTAGDWFAMPVEGRVGAMTPLIDDVKGTVRDTDVVLTAGEVTVLHLLSDVCANRK